MSSAFLNGTIANRTLTRGVNRLPIGSSAFVDAITFPGVDTFRISELGEYILDLSTWVVGRSRDVSFNLQLWNDTLGVLVQEVSKIAQNDGRENLVAYSFNFTVANVLHDYVIRINVINGDLTQAMDIVSTNGSVNFRATVSMFASEGIVGPGTVNTVSKFTAPQVVGDSNITDDGTTVTINSDAVVTGDLQVQGAVMSVETQTVLVEDNHIYMNAGYATAVAQTGGLAVNYLPTAVVDTVAVGGFTAGVGGVSDPTVATTGAATFAGGDLVQISGATDPANNGLFEVQAHAGNVMTLRGVGLNPTVEDFTQTQLVTDATVAGAITQVNVSVMRSGVDGVWESARGNVTGFAFVDVIDGVGTINTVPKFTAAGTLGDSRITDDATTIDFIVALKLRSAAAPAAFANGAGAGIDFYWRTEDALAASVARGGDLIVTVGAGDGAGRDGTFSVPGAGAGSEKFGLAAVADGANAVAVGNAAVANGARCTVTGQGSGATMTGADNCVYGQGNAAVLTTGQQNTWAGNLIVEAANNVTNSVCVGYGSHVTNTSTVVGALSCVNMTGADNTTLGQGTAGTLVGGIDNVVIGHTADTAAADTNSAVVVGANAAQAAVNGVTIGDGAALLVTGTANTIVGQGSAVTLVAGTASVVVGQGSALVMTGSENTILGQGSSVLLTGGTGHVVIGQGSAIALVANDNCTVVGHDAAVAMTGGTNTILGQASAPTLVAGTANVVIGQSADTAAVDTASAVVVGAGAAQAAVNGVTIGHGTALLVTGNANTVVGQGSAVTLAAGTASVVVGQGSALVMTGGSNTILGQDSGNTLATGGYNVVIGKSADTAAVDTASAVVVGAFSAQVASQGVTIGHSAAPLVTGINNTVIGQASAPTLVAGTANVVIGQSADTAAVDTASAVVVGAGAAQAAVNGVTIGHGTALLVTGTGNTVVGQGSAVTLAAGTASVVVGQGAALLMTGSENTILGQGSSVLLTGGTGHVVIGQGSAIALVANDNCTVVGHDAAVAMTGGTNTILGQASAPTLTTGTANVVIGQSADVAVAGTAEVVVVGAGAAQAAVDGVTIGYGSAPLVTGTGNTVVGHTCGLALQTGIDNVVIGKLADLAAGSSNSVVVGAMAQAGLWGVTIGYGAAALVTGTSNVVIGRSSASTLVAGTANVIIGQAADTIAASASSVVLGANASGTASNQFVVGSTANLVSDVYIGEGTDAATADTDGQDVTVHIQAGGAHAAADPRGGDWIWDMAEHGAGGTGRVGRMEWQQDDAETIGVKFRTWHNSASPAAGDYPFSWDFTAEDSGGVQRIIAQMQIKWDDPTAATMDSSWEFSTQDNANAVDFNKTATLTSAGVWTVAPCWERLKTYEGTAEELWDESYLDRISRMKIGRYHAKSEDGRSEEKQERHITPTVDDMSALFGLTTKGIAGVDVGGIALAGMQELIEENKALKKRVELLEAA